MVLQPDRCPQSQCKYNKLYYVHTGLGNSLFGVAIRRVTAVREEVGTKACIVGKIVKSRMQWARHMVRMKVERLRKRTETKKQGGRGRRNVEKNGQQRRSRDK